MLASTDQQLHELYWELGQAQAECGRQVEAADSYALALYYARRLGDADLMKRCRARIVEAHPTHLGGKESPAPLFFAQLLIRYPADEAAHALSLLKRTSLGDDWPVSPSFPVELTTVHRPTPSSMDRPFSVAGETPFADLLESAVPSAPGGRDPRSLPESREPASSGSLSGQSNFENHHVYDLGTGSIPVEAPSRAVDDFFFEPSLLPDKRESWSEMGFWGSALQVFGSLTAIAGVVALGFFSYELIPTLARFDAREVVQSLVAPVEGSTTQDLHALPNLARGGDGKTPSTNLPPSPPTRIGMNADRAAPPR